MVGALARCRKLGAVMSQSFNIYCDESCHLEHDHQKAMVLGAVWCPRGSTQDINRRLREIKVKHGFPAAIEAKWTKVSPSGLEYYASVIDYFFDNNDMRFRGLVIPDKSRLQHDHFGEQDHNTWYYKMYFNLLKVILHPDYSYRIFIDIKDTRGGSKIKKLHEVLCNAAFDFSREIVEFIQIVDSRDVEILQVADLLAGTISYLHRDLSGSAAKLALVDQVRRRSGYKLKRSTLLQEEKFNLFVWRPQEDFD